MIRNALLSDCWKYRYWLTRVWDEKRPVMGFVMLNPSTADELNDDPTIRKCIGFARRSGFGGITVVNLYAFRATKPSDLYKAMGYSGAYTVGPENNAHIIAKCKEVELVVAAWGKPANRVVKERAAKVLCDLTGAGIPVYCIRRNGDDSPAHPLMLSYTNIIDIYRRAA